jgi:rhodanese-related sulfurtransferase
VVLVAPPGRANEARIRLARIGFDRVVGSLEDIELELLARPELAERAPKVTAAEVAQWQLGGRWQLRGQGQSSGQQQSGGQERSGGQELQILDVRNPGELEDGAMNGARNVPLPQLLDRISELEPAVTTVVYCAGGYRSSTAASLLRSSGFANVVEISGGYAAASQDHSIPTVDVRAAADRPVGVALLDVREPEEWDEGHAVDAIHQPLGSLDASTLPFEGSVYVICRSGNRSATAARQLRAAGIDAHNVVGGMLAWTAAGLPATHTA